jgi:alcohol dehydrogenase (NADP+)
VIVVNACAVAGPTESFEATTIERRAVGPRDVLIDIAYCGICHSDVSHARSEWGHTTYPLVPGHEIAGRVVQVGPEVSRFAIGDRVGVGCMVDSCRECAPCLAGMEQYCEAGHVLTYGAVGRDGRRTQGGYSERIVVDEAYVLRVPDALSLPNAAPLLCAGITTYSPLKRWGAAPGRRVAIVGFGGLGHVAVQIAAALGAHTTVLDLSTAKHEDGLRLGADDYRATTDPATFTDLARSFDLIVSTVPANLDYDAYLSLLAVDGTFANVGVPHQPISVDVFSLLRGRRAIVGSLIGGIGETQEMLDFCATHRIGAEVEVIDAAGLDAAYDRVLAGDVRYRFVVDIATLADR